MRPSAAAPDEETFGEMVRKLRDRLPGRISQAKFAEMAGLSERTVQNIESGESMDPAPTTVRGIAAALTLPVGALSRKLGWIPIEEADPNWILDGLEVEDQRWLIDMIARMKAHPDSVLPRRAVRS
jgi:transcriptional regulator with XRE-family HTH domain